MPARSFIALLAGFLAAVSSVYAQRFPGGTVRIVVPFPASGATDVLGRVLSVNLEKRNCNRQNRPKPITSNSTDSPCKPDEEVARGFTDHHSGDHERR